ncbi:MAG: transposase [Pirellulaceae bacterium]
MTFHLDDVLPQAKIRELQAIRREWEAKHPPPRTEEQWESYVREVTVKAERWMDEGHGRCYFRASGHAQLLADALLHFQDDRYIVSCLTVMPNHCHLVVKPSPGHELEKILQAWKGYVSHEVNLAHNQTGSIWQQESYDRIVRDEEHLYRVIQYIGRNAAKAGLDKRDWVRWIHPAWQKAGWDFVDEK